MTAKKKRESTCDCFAQSLQLDENYRLSGCSHTLLMITFLAFDNKKYGISNLQEKNTQTLKMKISIKLKKKKFFFTMYFTPRMSEKNSTR